MVKSLIQKLKDGVTKIVLGTSIGLSGCGVGLQPEPDAPDVTAFIDVATSTFNEKDVQQGKNNTLTFTLYDRTCLSNIDQVEINPVEGKYGKPFPVDFSKEIKDNNDGTYTLKLILKDNENPFVTGAGCAYKITGVGTPYRGIFFYEKGASNEDLENRVSELENQQTTDKQDRDYFLNLLKQTDAGYVDAQGNRIGKITNSNKTGVRFVISGSQDLENAVESGALGLNVRFNEFGNNPYVNVETGQRTKTKTAEGVTYSWALNVQESNPANVYNSRDEELGTDVDYAIPGEDVMNNYSVSIRLGQN